MKTLRVILEYLIPIILIIGVIDSGHGIKFAPYLIYINAILGYSIIRLISKTRFINTYILSLILVFITLIGIFNTLICLIFPPIIEAVDCEGHHIQRFGYFLPSIITSFITTIILELGVFKQENKTNWIDKLMASIV